MTSREFCYWLQGYFEIAHAPGASVGFNASQIDIVKKHLGLVFKHEIDPSYGDEKHQAELDAVHNPVVVTDVAKEKLEALEKKVAALQSRPDGPLVMRC